jgi:hypothetical protein
VVIDTGLVISILLSVFSACFRYKYRYDDNIVSAEGIKHFWSYYYHKIISSRRYFPKRSHQFITSRFYELHNASYAVSGQIGGYTIKE